MKPKYIDERFRHYFIFGTSSSSEDKVSLNNGEQDVCLVTKAEAESLIKDRDEVLKLIHIFNEMFPEEFAKCLNTL